MAYFKNFEQDAKDFAVFAQKPLTMPMLVLSGEKSGGQFLIDQGKLVANNVDGVVVKGSGHCSWKKHPTSLSPSSSIS